MSEPEYSRIFVVCEHAPEGKILQEAFHTEEEAKEYIKDELAQRTDEYYFEVERVFIKNK